MTCFMMVMGRYDDGDDDDSDDDDNDDNSDEDDDDDDNDDHIYMYILIHFSFNTSSIHRTIPW